MKERKIFENIRRQILVVDDEEINRLILGNILSIDYDVIYASDGKEALEQMHQNKDMLSLVLLDLMMPEISGLEVLKILKDDSELSNIPVIVATVDKKSEIESLNLGAVDFIPNEVINRCKSAAKASITSLGITVGQHSPRGAKSLSTLVL